MEVPLLRVALYVRVSTDEQARDGHSIAAQRERLLAFARAQDWSVVDIYADEGMSGAELDKRPELSRLRRDVKDGKINLVLVWKIDRLSRRLIHLAELVDEFDRHGAGIRSVTEPFDTTHAAGRMMLQLLGVFAEFEREMIRERTRAGIRQRVKAGHIHGRPQALGYTAPGSGQVWQVDEREAQVVRWIYDQYLSGVGSMRIAQALRDGVPELPADVLKAEFSHLAPHSVADRIRWILKNPIYAGYTTLNGELLPGRHEAIIPEDDWRRAQNIFAQRGGMGPRSKTSPYILSGIIECGACGGAMWGYSQSRYPRGRNRPKTTTRTREQRYAYYVCKNATVMQGRSKTCTNWGIRKERTEEYVLETLRQLALAPAEVAASVPDEPAEDDTARRLRTLRSELAGLRRRQQSLISTIERAPDLEDTLLERLRELADEQRRLQAEIDALEAQAGQRRSQPSPQDVAAMLAHVGQILDNANTDQLRELVRMFVRRVVIMPAERRGAQKEIRVEFYPLSQA